MSGKLAAVPATELPTIPLRTSTIEVGGVEVPFRGLSRVEYIQLANDPKWKEDVDGAEAWVLSRGTGVTEEVARAWLSETDAEQAGKLVDAICLLSGMTREGGPTPQ